jgi:hypothetical protein
MRDALIEAPSKQGGHSKRGDELAKFIGIPFPVDMKNLEARAIELGFDPAELWPWYVKMKAQRRA